MISKLYTIISQHFRINYDLNLETAEFLELGLAILVKLCSAQGTNAHYV